MLVWDLSVTSYHEILRISAQSLISTQVSLTTVVRIWEVSRGLRYRLQVLLVVPVLKRDGFVLYYYRDIRVM